jgi:hypothetical protein
VIAVGPPPFIFYQTARGYIKLLESKTSHKNLTNILSRIQNNITNSHKNRIWLVSIIIDCLIITTTAALAFYQALESFNAKLAGTEAGFTNQGITESAILLAVFFFGVFRLVLDLGRRDDI